MYLRGSRGYPYKRRKVYPVNRSRSPIDEVVEICCPDFNCDTIPCSNIQRKYYRALVSPLAKKCIPNCTSDAVPCYNISARVRPPLPTSAADNFRTVGQQVSAIYKLRIPRDFFVGFEQPNFERRSRWLLDVPEEFVTPAVEMKKDPGVEKEKEWILTKDPLSEYYFYEELLDPLAETVAKVMPTEVVIFDPNDLGSHPPRSPGMLLFKEVKRKCLDNCTLDDLEEQALMLQKAQAERENPPGVTKRPDAIRRACHLPLKYFDNASLELRHPEVALKEAITKGERGLRARSKSFSMKWNETGYWEPCLTWKPCLVFSYDPVADLYYVIWLGNYGEETQRRKQVSR